MVQRQSENDPNEFRDFTVRRDRVAAALSWLKNNNKYYENINIDYATIQSLPENGSVINLLPQIRPEDKSIDDENEGDMISSTFVPLITPTPRESTAINITLNRMQNNDIHRKLTIIQSMNFKHPATLQELSQHYIHMVKLTYGLNEPGT